MKKIKALISFLLFFSFFTTFCCAQKTAADSIGKEIVELFLKKQKEFTSLVERLGEDKIIFPNIRTHSREGGAPFWGSNFIGMGQGYTEDALWFFTVDTTKKVVISDFDIFPEEITVFDLQYQWRCFINIYGFYGVLRLNSGKSMQLSSSMGVYNYWKTQPTREEVKFLKEEFLPALRRWRFFMRN